jgi:redox-sensitive bicupin YhaK (pirin superfamily)
LEGGQVALLASDDGGSLVRVIAGELGEHRGPGATHTPITLLHATVRPGARLVLPWRTDFNALVYVLAGAGRVSSEGRPAAKGQLAVLGPGGQIVLRGDDTPPTASEPDFEVLVLGGQPIREPVAAYGPFVMNTRAELAQAVEDFQAGRLGTIPADGLQPFHPRG